jgi:hypothetical protein
MWGCFLNFVVYLWFTQRAVFEIMRALATMERQGRDKLAQDDAKLAAVDLPGLPAAAGQRTG